jgi:hypothetical protein
MDFKVASILVRGDLSDNCMLRIGTSKFTYTSVYLSAHMVMDFYTLVFLHVEDMDLTLYFASLHVKLLLCYMHGIPSHFFVYYMQINLLSIQL